ncbi:MAG: hypothetical protein WBH01_01130 [Dehalococcoidia bacterium]
MNSRKNSRFYKTNHPAFPHALSAFDPNNNISCIYAQNDKGKFVELLGLLEFVEFVGLVEFVEIAALRSQ